MTNVLNLEKLNQLFQANWTHLLDRITLMRKLLEDVRQADYNLIEQSNLSVFNTKLTITKFVPCDKGIFELWIEFTVPKNDGFVQGSHIYNLSIDGEIILKSTYGVNFVTKKPE